MLFPPQSVGEQSFFHLSTEAPPQNLALGPGVLLHQLVTLHDYSPDKYRVVLREFEMDPNEHTRPVYVDTFVVE